MLYRPDQCPKFLLDGFSTFEKRIPHAFELDIALPAEPARAGMWSIRALVTACVDRTHYLNRVLPAVETESALPYLRRAADCLGAASLDLPHEAFTSLDFNDLRTWKPTKAPIVVGDVLVDCPGHVYRDRGHPLAPTLQFLRRASKAVAYDLEFAGVNTQQVLCASIFRLREGILETTDRNKIIAWAAAVECLRKVVFFYECRAWTRKEQHKNRLDAHVFDDERMTRPPFGSAMIEEFPTGVDGHIDIAQHAESNNDWPWRSQEEAEIWSDLESEITEYIYSAPPFSTAVPALTL